MPLTTSTTTPDLERAVLVQQNELELNGPASLAVAVTPSDSADIPHPAGYAATRGIYVGSAGDLTVTLAGGGTVTLGGLAAGIIHPLRVTRVHATGTTAGGVVALY